MMMRLVWEKRHYIQQTITSKRDPGHQECEQTKQSGLDSQLYAFIGNCRLRNGHGRPREPGGDARPWRDQPFYTI